MRRVRWVLIENDKQEPRNPVLFTMLHHHSIDIALLSISLSISNNKEIDEGSLDAQSGHTKHHKTMYFNPKSFNKSGAPSSFTSHLPLFTSLCTTRGSCTKRVSRQDFPTWVATGFPRRGGVYRIRRVQPSRLAEFGGSRLLLSEPQGISCGDRFM